jgi:hypothetical protein
VQRVKRTLLTQEKPSTRGRGSGRSETREEQLTGNFPLFPLEKKCSNLHKCTALD